MQVVALIPAAVLAIVIARPASACLDQALLAKEARVVAERIAPCWDTKAHPPGRYVVVMKIVERGRGVFVGLRQGEGDIVPSKAQRACLVHAIEDRSYPAPPEPIEEAAWTPWGGHKKLHSEPASITIAFPVAVRDPSGGVPETDEAEAEEARGLVIAPPVLAGDPLAIHRPLNTSPVSLRPMGGCASCTTAGGEPPSAAWWLAGLLLFRRRLARRLGSQ